MSYVSSEGKKKGTMYNDLYLQTDYFIEQISVSNFHCNFKIYDWKIEFLIRIYRKQQCYAAKLLICSTFSKKVQPGVCCSVAHLYPSTGKAEAGGSLQVWGQPKLCNKTLSQKTKMNFKMWLVVDSSLMQK